MTPAMKNTLATAYGVDADQARLYTTAPTATAPGTEVTGGTYAPQTITWSAPTNGVITGTVIFDVPAGVTVAGAGVHRADGTFLDGGAVASQSFATAGTYELALTYTQS
jgi:hypothetical protein